jgi:hypothetical protein
VSKFLAQAENIGWSEEEAKEAISHLIKTRKLKKLKSPFWKNKLVIGEAGSLLLQ